MKKVKKRKRKWPIVLAVILGILLTALGIFFIYPYSLKCRVGMEDFDLNGSNLTGWMGEIDGSKSLSDINIPGTHDSATKYSQFSMITKCQFLSIKEQLENGFRMLDIRLEGISKTNKLKLVHSIATCRKGLLPTSGTLYLDDVINDCLAFLDENPTETIIFCTKHDNGDMSIPDFQKLLDSYIQKNPDRWYTKNMIPTLDEVRGKLVLVRRHDDEAGLGERAGLGLSWADQGGKADGRSFESGTNPSVRIYVQDRYNYDTKDKYEAFKKSIFKSPARNKTGVVNVSFLSTMGSGKLGHPRKYAVPLNKMFFAEELSESEKYGWIFLDYGNAALAEKIFKTN